MVKVNSLNFVAELPGLEACLARAEFVAFDLEMTGIMGTERNPKDDGVEERYQRMSPTATKYSIIQVGLCFFERSGEGGGYVASPYSFFLFPEWGPDLIMSPSSITFLKKNGMDFNEWINHGVSFVNSNGATKMREQRAERAAAAAAAATAGGSTNKEPPSTLMPNRPAEIEQMNALKASIAEWAADPNSAVEFVVPSMNAFLRRCVYAYVEVVHPELKTRKDDTKPNEIVILKVTEEQREALTLAEEAKFKEKLGFRLVFEMLQAAGKPIVGHNCFFDLLFLFRWLDGPHPGSFSAFRDRFADLFPAGVYDTKYCAESNLIAGVDPMEGDTALQPLYEKVVGGMGETRGLISYASAEMEYKGAEKQAHDAGYDAYMTGAIFSALRLAAGVDTIRDKAWNRLFLMQSLYSFSLDPNKENPNLLRVHTGDIYHVSWANLEVAEVKNATIEACFVVGMASEAAGVGEDAAEASPAPVPSSTLLEIMWINGSSAFLVVKAGSDLPNLPEGWVVKPLEEIEETRRLKRLPPSGIETETDGHEGAPAKRVKTENEGEKN